MLRFLFIFCLSLLLSASSFSLYDLLSKKIAAKGYSSAQLELAIKHDVTEALRVDIENHKTGSRTWLALAKKLARTDADFAWQLHHYYQAHNVRNSAYFKNRALAMGFKPAVIDQAQQLATRGSYVAALKLLQPLDDETKFELALDYVIASGSTERITKLLSESSKYLNKQRLTELQRYHIIKTANTREEKVYCPYPVQFFATTLGHLQKIDEHIKQLEKQPALSQYFCFLTPKYIAKQNLQCTNDASTRLTCSFNQIAIAKIANNVRYVGVLATQGIANVNNGMIFIDQHDTLDVFEHELWHLLGFIDEYPLPELHGACDRAGSPSHNIVVTTKRYFTNEQEARQWLKEHVQWSSLILPTTPIGMNTAQGFRLGTPLDYRVHVGLYPARTCDHSNNALQAYKPVYSYSKMEYYETLFPADYLALFKLAPTRYLMPSYQHFLARQQKNSAIEVRLSNINANAVD
ncbi:hypothetical protein [Thalassotalea maritima]|uniref:hypothetical protein n=1 Tax=Thalassotalea maritima TaxID=3242416 RepID=UPI003526C4B9